MQSDGMVFLYAIIVIDVDSALKESGLVQFVASLHTVVFQSRFQVSWHIAAVAYIPLPGNNFLADKSIYWVHEVRVELSEWFLFSHRCDCDHVEHVQLEIACDASGCADDRAVLLNPNYTTNILCRRRGIVTHTIKKKNGFEIVKHKT